MKKIISISDGDNYTAVSIGKLEDLENYAFIHPKNNQKVEGRVFLKDATKATGTEVSFQVLPPHTELSYFQYIKKNEETYIILKGAGDFQVDDNCFPIEEGSIIRVAPEGKRGIRNTSDAPMVYIVIQSKERSLEEHTYADGERVTIQSKWSK